jgi:hypothetical protein
VWAIVRDGYEHSEAYGVVRGTKEQAERVAAKITETTEIDSGAPAYVEAVPFWDCEGES